MKDAVNVCGLVIHVSPGAGEAVSGRLAGMAGIDVHAVDGDRLVVTAIDTAEQQALEQMAAINRLPGVVSTALAYHQIEEVSEPAGCACGSGGDCSSHTDLLART